MRKTRHRLQVSTFPFLAVLLCAMGALILVLLAMDRRGRMAARARAAEQQQAQEEDYKTQLAAREQAQQSKKAALEREWEAQRRDQVARLDAEEKALNDRLAAARARKAEAARRLQEEEDRAAQMRQQLAAQKAQMQKKADAVAEAQREEAERVKKLREAEAQRARATTQLVSLEKTVDDLKKARAEDAERFSVVPYHGKQGARRKPVHIECVGDDIIFHPEGKRLAVADEEKWRSEAESRLRVGGTARPYVLVFIRPSGIKGSYALTGMLNKAEVDFGYEMVEEAWKFDFKEDVVPPTETVSQPGLGRSVALNAPRPLGTGTVEQMPPPLTGNAVTMSPPLGTPGGGGELKPPTLMFPTSRELPPLGGAPPGTETPKGSKQGEPKQGEPKQGESKQDEKGKPDEKEKAGEGPQLPGDGQGPVGMKPPRKPKPNLRPADINSNELIVYIECQADWVVVHPSRSRMSVRSLAGATNYNPLFHEVERALGRRPPGGGQPRKQVRFIVHPDGGRTFHLVYPMLDKVMAQKTQQWAQPGDDISTLIGQ